MRPTDIPPPPSPDLPVREALDYVTQVYAQIEPDGQDTWNPVADDVEMWHRTRLLREACRLLRLHPKPAHTLRVLDVGCGVGRSARMLVDLGVQPGNLVAIDLRPAALATARANNPAIDWRLVIGLDDWPDETFDLVVQCTVFSSLPGEELRRATADRIRRAAGPDGHILWWDSHTANAFAGGDVLDPRPLFSDRKLLSCERLPMLPTLDEALRPLRGLKPVVAAALRPLGHRRTHCAALFGPQVSQSSLPPTPLADTPSAPPGSKDLLHDLPTQSADACGLAFGAWEVFQHRPLLEVYANHYGHQVVEVDGILVVVRKMPGLGAMRAQCYSPEAKAGAEWSSRLQHMNVGELVVMSNQPAGPVWPETVDSELVSMVIDLRGDAAAMLARFEQRARTAARKGEKAGVTIEETASSDDVAAFHAVVTRLSDGGQRFPLTPLPLIQTLIDAGHGTLYLARQGDLVLGGCVVLRHRYAHALLSGFDSRACGGLPSTHLYVQIMLSEQQRGIPYLDFGPHNVRLHGSLVLAKRAFKPLIVPAYRYERPGIGWRPHALAALSSLRRLRGLKDTST